MIRVHSWTTMRLVLWVAVALGALYASQLVLHATSTSATVDEPVHMLAGYRHVTCGDYAFNPEHPPLVKQVAALPLLTVPIKAPQLPCAAGFTSKPDSFQLGNRFLVDNQVYRILVPARLAIMLFSLLLALLVYVVARRMVGGWGPAIALGLVAMEPVLIAHGSLVTTDMAITTATFASMWVLYRAPKMRPWAVVPCLGLALGLMLATKHSALVILPGLVLAYALDGARSAPGRSSWSLLAGKLGTLAAAGALALGLLWSVYEFRYSATPNRAETVELKAFLSAVGRPGIAESGSATALQLMASSRLFPEAYLMGLADIIGTGRRPSRILGQAYESGQWFYFPIALSLKTSIPVLLLFPVGIAALYRSRRRRELLYLSIPPLAYFLVCLTSGINIGVRHVLPVYPFLVVLAAAGAWAIWCRDNRAWRWALAALLAYQAVTVARASPDYLPFANALWGGTDKGHEVLQDANAEWGQSLKRVEQYVAREGIRECWYAGVGAPMLHRAEQPCRLLPDGYRWLVVDPLEPAVPSRIGGTIFMSVRMLPPRGGPEYQPLLDAGATRILAGTLLVFEGEFDLPLVAALSHARRADALVVAGRIEEALVEAQRAKALAPDDPRTRTSLAIVFLQLGQHSQAAIEAAHARRLVDAQPGLYGFVRHRLDPVLMGLQRTD